MRRGEVWWAEFDERRPVVLLSEEDPSGFQAMQVVAPADTDISGLGIEVAVGVREGLSFDGVLRFAFPRPGLTPCTWLTTLSREDLIERAGAGSAAKLSEIDDALRASEQRAEWTPAAAARLSEIKDSLRRRTQADGEGTDAQTGEGRSRPHDRLSVAPQQQDHDLRLEYQRPRIARLGRP
ncbi:MAG TPA: type II toxin-antitoxin system PemK/MazF family toxin [Streptosporangiaceae bacterium]|nr:type II toxin-antitoxin system PemK/MazF family toxin [Streptosporangiaceae bacterium]